MSTTRVLNKK